MTFDIPESFRRLRPLSALAAAATFLALAPAASASDAHPCGVPVSKSWSTKGSVQPCPLTSPEANGRIPVYAQPVARGAGAALPAPQGWLHGTAGQYFVCQTRAASFHHGRGWRNNWWGYTAADSGIAWGYVPQVYFMGGNNDEPDAGLRRCDASAPPSNPDPQPAAPEPPRCGSSSGYEQMRINDDQRVRISAGAIDHRYREITTTTPPERHTHSKTRHRAGSTTLHLATCKRRGKPWTLLRAGAESIRVDHPKQLHRLRTGEPWLGFAIRRIEPRFRDLRGRTDQVARIHVEGVYCERRGSLSLLKTIAGFPLPGVSYAVGLGQWIGGSIWPDSDSIKCGRLDTTTATLYVNKRTGRLSAGGFVVSQYVHRVRESEDGFYMVRLATVRSD